MASRRVLAGLIVAWTLIAWGGRVGLLVGGEGWTSWVRIGGSLMLGLLAAAVLVLPGWRGLSRPILVTFSAWTVLLWGRSLIVTWTGSGSLAFKLVHTVLAAGFFALAVWAWRTTTRSDSISTPNEGDGEKQRDGETTGLTKS